MRHMNADMLPRLAARPEPHRNQPPHDSPGWGEAPVVLRLSHAGRRVGVACLGTGGGSTSGLTCVAHTGALIGREIKSPLISPDLR
jgi:hypothetical protein